MALPIINRRDLLIALEKQIKTGRLSLGVFGIRGLRTGSPTRRFLGIFTGQVRNTGRDKVDRLLTSEQGAQWATMGQTLYLASSVFRDSMHRCEKILRSCIESPSWSLVAEMQATSHSRVHEAAISQPLCTAVQISLVNLLRIIGIKFDIVVGHSSGEIAAAFAADVLTENDSMAISYYRGLAAQSAPQNGGMMAVSMSWEDAIEFCKKPDYKGKLIAAASNSPGNVTISGDSIVLAQAQKELEDSHLFARRLRVDVAYHSHQMDDCAKNYRAYLREHKIIIRNNRIGCAWISSLWPDVDMSTVMPDTLAAEYWVDNMTQPVRFSQALKKMVADDLKLPDLIIEVGPHPALEVSVRQILNACRETSIPHLGCLRRNENDLETFSSLIGAVWCHLGSVEFGLWRQAFDLPSPGPMPKGLPSYPWDHDQPHWQESRVSRMYRLGSSNTHELLGRICEDYGDKITWRNMIRLQEIPWLAGHKFQGQVVFPAAAYISMSLDAVKRWDRGRMISHVAVEDMVIHRGLVIEEDLEVETIFQLNRVTDLPSRLEARFALYSCSDGRTLMETSTGRLIMHFESLPRALCTQMRELEHTIPPLDPESFYQAVDDVSIQYSGVFRTLKNIRRIWGYSTASAVLPQSQLSDGYELHPAILDVAFQLGFATFLSTAPNSARGPYLPISIRRLAIDPSVSFEHMRSNVSINAEAHLVGSSDNTFELDVEVCECSKGFVGIQVEGLTLKLATEPLPSKDRFLYTKTIWDIDASGSLHISDDRCTSKDESEHIDAVERTALFFLSELIRENNSIDTHLLKWHHREFLQATELLLSSVRQGNHPVAQATWLTDDRITIDEIARLYPNSVEIELLHVTGQNWRDVMRGNSEMLQHMLKDDLLSRLYTDGRGFSFCNDQVAKYATKITHKYPQAAILEIGAGTGGTTRKVLDGIGNAYSSYTFTDISPGFFEKAAHRLSDHADRLSFKVLNIEESTVEQGFEQGSFDIIVAANVLHATRHLSHAVKNARSLLRNGGFLLIVEVTGAMLRETGLMGGLEGWWLGSVEGRFPSPGVSVEAWDGLLKGAGFSGIESLVFDTPDVSRHSCSAFITRAVDQHYTALIKPLSNVGFIPKGQSVLIISGGSNSSIYKTERVKELLKPTLLPVTVIDTIDSLSPQDLTPNISIMNLAELDSPLFSPSIQPPTLRNLKLIFETATNIVWLTHGRLAKNPHSNMVIGIGRALAAELPRLDLRFIEIADDAERNTDLAVETLLQMLMLTSSEFKEAARSMLWADEQEVLIKDGHRHIPRLIPDIDANMALAATRRRVQKPEGSHDIIEVIHKGDKTPTVVLRPMEHPHMNDNTLIRVDFSLRMRSADADMCFLCSGVRIPSQEPVFALSDTDASILSIIPGHVFYPPSTTECRASQLEELAAELIASHLILQCPEGDVIVHEPDGVVAAAVQHRLSIHGRKFIFTTCSQLTRDHLVNVHPLTSRRKLQQLLPFKNAKHLFSFSHDRIDLVTRALPAGCETHWFRPCRISRCQKTIGEAYFFSRRVEYAEAVPSIKVCDVAQSQCRAGILSTVIDWRRDYPIRAQVALSTRPYLFSPLKTYLLFGLTGELGQSLTRFMVACGASHIIVASRNATAKADWVSGIRADGTDILVADTDIRDFQQMRALLTQAETRGMPPIFGVMNGAMVLADSLFLDTDWVSINEILAPKVTGIMNLDKAFEDTTQLDFFIAFSSLGSVIGNTGQSIYHAANLFMSSMIEKRRLRGRVGSLINIGMIADVGYVAQRVRQGSKVGEHLKSQFYSPLSESEFHHLISQAILYGLPTSGNGELTMGFEPSAEAVCHGLSATVAANPRLSHMFQNRRRVVAGPAICLKDPGSTDLGDYAAASSGSTEEALQLFQNQMTRKIQRLLQMPSASIDIQAPLSDFGLDSLLAIEIRAWVLEYLHVEVSILGILSRESISTICSRAIYQLKQDGWRGRYMAESGSLSISSNDNTHSQNSLTTTTHDKKGSLGTSFKSCSSEIDSHSPTSLASTTPPEVDANEACREDDEARIRQPTSQLATDFYRDADHFAKKYPLSHAQESMFLMQSMLDDPTTFNVTAEYEIDGVLNVQSFAQALNEVLRHHEALRICIFTDPRTLETRQGLPPELESGAFTHINAPRSENRRILDGLARKSWNLSKGQCFRAILVTHSANSHSVLFGCHHIIMDGLSWHILLANLDRAYQLLPLRAQSSSYLDFASRQVRDMCSGKLESSISYWLDQLQPLPEAIPPLAIAEIRHRRKRRSFRNHHVQREINADMVAKIQRISLGLRLTLMQFYLSNLVAMMHCMLEVEHLCIGVTDSGQGTTRPPHTIGHFVNMLPISFRVAENMLFTDLARGTAKTVLECFARADVALDLIIERLGNRHPIQHMPLFQIAYNYRAGSLMSSSLGPHSMTLIRYTDTKNPYDFTFNISQAGDGKHLLEVTSCGYLYSAASTELVLDSYLSFLEGAVNGGPDLRVRQLSCLTAGNDKQLVVQEQAESRSRAWPDGISARFMQVVAENANSVAMGDGRTSLSYAELEQRVFCIAFALKQLGVGRGARVSVLTPPCVDTYASMLAILRIGAFYAPLDADLPTPRLRTIIKTCEPGLILANGITKALGDELARSSQINLLNLDQVSQDAGETASIAQSFRGGFILFTSGSTGKPKAVVLKEEGIMNYARAKSELLDLQNPKVLQQSSVAFDMSIAQVINAVMNAGELVIAPASARGDPQELAKLILSHGVDMVIATPSEYVMLATYARDAVSRCLSWRHACSGGEPISGQLLTRLRDLRLPHLRLTDFYGPTEISCAATFRQIPLDPTPNTSGVSLGTMRSLANVHVYVMDKDLNPLPPGFPGEVCVGGVGVAEGYLNKEQNLGVFVPNPFWTATDVARRWKTLYRTGDRGCIATDGGLVLLGRMNGSAMVKLRGLRIDLDEVSDAIVQAARGGLAEAVVTARGDPEFLVAHVVPMPGSNWSPVELDRLSTSLPFPRYMVPSRILLLEKIPHTANGKVDRAAVQRLSLPLFSKRFKADKELGVVEEELKILWKSILGQTAGGKRIDDKTDFFNIGASSLQLVRLQGAIAERTGVQLLLSDLYRDSTLGRMASLISNARSHIGAHESIDWDKETEVPSALLRVAQVGKLPFQDDRRRVVLTGATSFLGSHVLKALLSDSNVSRIFCIAVPPGSHDQIIEDPRVTLLSGSLRSHRLGLSSEDQELLELHADHIIHAASQGHCLNNYMSLRGPNVDALKFLTSMALKRHIPLLFVSSGRVTLASGSFSVAPGSMALFSPPTDGSQGYTASKWAGEVFLEKLSQKTNLPVAIHRICSVVGAQAPPDDALNSVIHYSRLMRRVPSIPQARGFFDFKDVEVIARDIVSDIRARTSHMPTILFRHHSGGVKVPFQELAQRMESLYGGHYETLSLNDWIESAQAIGLENLVVSYLKANVAGATDLTFPYLGMA
ncbi:lovastatin nonaketide synthase [Nemania sp. FL0916]|nr:lovastatin nonaketide synthase [Nemania sp. FL0916]